MSEISQSSRTTTVESNMKSEHNLYLACEDSPPRAFFFCTFSCSCLVLLASTVHWLRCFLFLNAANCWLHSTPQNVYVAEDWPHCPTRPPLSRSAVLPCPPWFAARGWGLRTRLASSILPCQCMWRMSSSACTWAQIDIHEHDRHVITLSWYHCNLQWCGGAHAECLLQ